MKILEVVEPYLRHAYGDPSRPRLEAKRTGLVAGPDLEVELLPFSGKLIAFELGIRFRTEYLEGDSYFRVTRNGQNLDRCRTQLALVKSIEDQEDQMLAFVKKGARFD